MSDDNYRRSLAVIAAHPPGHDSGWREPAAGELLQCYRCGAESEDVSDERGVRFPDGTYWTPLCARCEEACVLEADAEQQAEVEAEYDEAKRDAERGLPR